MHPTSKLTAVIPTEKTLSRIFAFLVVAFLVLVTIPTTSAADLSKDTPIESEKEWWEDWSADTDHDRVEDNLIWFIDKENLETHDIVSVVVDYLERPTIYDQKKLIRLGGEVLYVSKYLNSIVANVTVGDLEEIASWSEVVMVEFAPDAQLAMNSALPTIGVPTVWQDLGYYGEGVTIAIVDTGIDDEHVALDDIDDDPGTDDPKVIAFYDAAGHPNQDDGTYEPFDNHGHGTHCAGNAAGTGAPNYNNIGVAPRAKLVGVRIGGGGISMNNAMRGVEWVIDNKEKFGIDIMSNSWGLYIGGPSNQNGQSALSRLMDEAVDAGITVFCAAGNTAISLTVYSPADSEKAMAVGSVNDNHVLSLFSSQGPTADGRIKPDICAVGESVTAPRTNSGTGYVTYDGTSMACPMAAGVGALIIDANPDLTPLEIKQLFHETSEHNIDARFPFSPNNGYGWGVVEAYGAVKRARDLSQTYINAPPVVHEGDEIGFSANTTYTRTFFTYKGEDGMRIIGDDELLYEVRIPANWSIPTNITVSALGVMEYDAIFQVPRFENGMWVIEAEFHFDTDVDVPTFATPILTFESTTPEVDEDTTYPLYYNMTLNGINGTKVIDFITVDNQDPPEISIIAPVEGEKVAGSVSISGWALDPDVGDDVEEVYIRINDGDWELAEGTNDWDFLWNTSELNNGMYTIYAVANDGEENSSVMSVTVELDNFNLQPSAFIDSITPNPANEGEDVSFSGYGLDDDGFITEYEWRSNIEGILSTEAIFSTSTLPVGVHEISFRVRDNDGVWSQMMELDLRINQIPLAYIDAVWPNPANEDQVVSFAGHGADDRDITTYNWRSSMDGFLSDSPSFSTLLSIGNHVIYFRVQDDDGIWSDEVTLSLRINGIPVAYIDSLSPNPARDDEVVSFIGHGIDDVAITAYEWSSSLDGELSMESNFQNGTLSLGDHEIAFRVRDDDGVWSPYVYEMLKIVPVPTAIIDSISPNPANQSDPVTFTGHGEDVGEILDYSWRSDVDGFLSNEASFTTTSLSSEIHTIYFSVKNDNETWSDEVVDYIRINGAPTAVIEYISPNPALFGETVELKGNGTDDGDIAGYSWSSNLDGYLGDLQTIITDQLALGTHTISLSVMDDDFLWSTEVTTTLKIHESPTAYIDDITPASANQGDEVFFEGRGIDDGSIAAYEWHSSKDTFLSGLPSFSRADLSVGDHIISFRVMDNDGIWSDTVIRELRINGLPTAFIDSITPNPANEKTNVNFQGHGDDDRVLVDHNWRSDIDGFLSNQASFETSTLSLGVHTIFFMVQDDDGIWSDEKWVTLRINQIPTAFIDTISPSFVNQGEDVVFEGHGYDDGSIIAYNWSSSIDGFLSSERNFTASGLSVGEHIIKLTVKDDDSAWSTEVMRLLRINQIPQAVIDVVTPSRVLVNQEVRFEGHGIDDEDIATYHWSSSIDGYLSGSDSFVWTGLSQGLHTIKFKVKDQDNVWSDEVMFFDLYIHERPTAKILTITPNVPLEDDPISFTGEGLDDGFIEEYNWTSSIDDFLSPDSEFTKKLSAGTHIISLTVMDNYGIWSKKASRTLYVNQKPQATIESISPDPAYQGDLVLFSGFGTDDSSISDFRWVSNINGLLGSDASISTSSLSVGTHDISFSVKDDRGVWSSEAHSSLTINIWTNLIPTVTLLAPTNGDLISHELIIQAEGFDEDGRVEAIEAKIDEKSWFRISDSSIAFYKMDHEEMGAGEHVIYVRAFDGEDYSDEEFVIVTVKESEEGGFSFEDDGEFYLSILGIIILVVVVLLVILFMSRRRGKNQYIRI